jgi:hypothetical protein
MPIMPPKPPLRNAASLPPSASPLAPPPSVVTTAAVGEDDFDFPSDATSEYIPPTSRAPVNNQELKVSLLAAPSDAG